MRMSAALLLSRLIRNADNSQIRTRHTDVDGGLAFLASCNFVIPEKPLANLIDIQYIL